MVLVVLDVEDNLNVRDVQGGYHALQTFSSDILREFCTYFGRVRLFGRARNHPAKD